MFVQPAFGHKVLIHPC